MAGDQGRYIANAQSTVRLSVERNPDGTNKLAPDGSASSPLYSVGSVPVDDDLKAVPVAAANGFGQALAKPANATGLMIYLSAGESVTYALASAQPSAAPAQTVTVSGDAYKLWTEPMGPNMNAYITAKAGNPRYRFV